MIAYFVRHTNAANLMMLAAVILGLSVVTKMERETFPAFAPSKVSVTVAYPGASAVDVDEGVCQEIDNNLNSITQLDELECQSIESRATAVLTMSEGGDISQFFNDILSEVSALSNLPDNAEEPTVAIAAQTEQIALIAVSGIDNSASLRRYADRLTSEIDQLPGIADAKVTGISEQELLISFNSRALRQYGLSARDVSDALVQRSLRQPLGTTRTRDRDVILRYSDIRRTKPELENLVILQSDTGGFVRLKDIGEVRLLAASDEVQSYTDGVTAAIIEVSKNTDDDAIRAFSQLETLIASEQDRLPAPFKITVINDSTEIIRDRIRVIVKNTITGLFLVFLVMSLYFSLSEAFWISAALPVSFLGGVFVLFGLGQTINMVSLIGFLMALGLIMDDSIVIADNIAKWRSKVGAKEASLRGVTEVLPGVFSSFLTTACVFAPLMFLSGEIGKILLVVPIVLLVTLAISLFEAFFILPHHLSHVKSDPVRAAKRIAPRVTEWVKTEFVLPTVALFIRWRYLTVGLTFALLVSTFGILASGNLKVVAFPTTEGDTIEARLALATGTPLDRTVGVIDQLTTALEAINQQHSAKTETGGALVERVLVRYAANRDVKANGAHTATITVDLQSSETRNITATRLLELWQQQAGPVPDLVQSNFTQTAVGPGGSDLDVELSSFDPAALKQASAALYRQLVTRADVTDAYQDFSGGQAEISLSLTEFGYAVGLTPQNLSSQMRTAFSGLETDSFSEGFSDFAVRVELSDSVPTISDLEQFPITLPSGGQAALNSVVKIEIAQSYTQITRKDGKTIARIIGKIDRDVTTSSAISALIRDDLGPALQQQFPSVTVNIGGATEAMQETQASIITAFGLGLIGVYMILVFQFHSYTLPFVVMLSIPFAMIGTILGHLLIGIDLAMPSLVGFASLAGIVVNNAILFLTFFEKETRNDDYLTAAVEAVGHRFRPVLLSFATTFVGLLPIIFETSPQAQTMVPLVVSVAFGLLSSTLLAIFVIPSALSIYFDFFPVGKWLASRSGGAEPKTGNVSVKSHT